MTHPAAPVLTGRATPQEVARTQESVVRLSGATARAVSHRHDLERRWTRWQLGRQSVPARAPHVHPAAQVDDWPSHRGATDAVALLVRHSDPATFLATTPGDGPVADLVFAMLEQFRVESLADPSLRGLLANLEHRFHAWSMQVIGSDLIESEQGLLILTVAQVCRSRVLAWRIDDRMGDLIEPTRFAIASTIGDPLARLRPTRHDQTAYAEVAAHLARSVTSLVAEAHAAAGTDAEDGPDDDRDDAGTAALSLLVGFDEEAEPVAGLELARSDALSAHESVYRTFTTAHDRCDPARALVPTAERGALDHTLEHLVRESGLSVARLAQAMGRTFTAAERSTWESDLEEGELDPSRLTRPVARVGDARVFRSRLDRPSPTTAVTILLDCSGSMKAHRERIAPLIQVWGRAMNRAGLDGEILGHTTRTWGGSLARKDWQRAGRPGGPGRLAELQHLVLRDVTANRSRDVHAAALLRTSGYRESVDGEAILWAAGRLRSIEARRHVLAVVTDGSPMETSTARANDSAYLDHHLATVIDELDRSEDIDLVGVGVGLDLSGWFSRYHVLDLADPLPHVALELLGTLSATG